MLEILSGIIILSVTIGALLFRRSYYGNAESHTSFSFPPFLFALWLVSTAMWGRYFFTYRVGDIVDLSIDRFLFVIVATMLFGQLVSVPAILRGSRQLELLFLSFCSLCLASMVIHGFGAASPKYPSPWHMFISSYLFPAVAFLFAKRYLVTERNLTILFTALFYLGTYLAVIAFFEFYGLRQFVYPSFINDPKIWLHLDRARGPLLNSALNGFALVAAFICGVHLLSMKEGFGRLMHLALLTLFFPAIFFTLTRSVYLCFIVTIGTLLFGYRTSFPKWKLLALPLALLFVVAIFNFSRLASSERRAGGVYQVDEVLIRQALLQRSAVMILDNPVFGVGFAQFIPASVAKYKGVAAIAESLEEQSQHNQIIAIAVELGLVGVALYLLIVITIFKRIAQLLAGLPKAGFINSNLALVIGLSLAVYMLSNLFIDSSFHLFPNAVFFTFAGIADGLYHRLNIANMYGEEMIQPGTFDMLIHNG